MFLLNTHFWNPNHEWAWGLNLCCISWNNFSLNMCVSSFLSHSISRSFKSTWLNLWFDIILIFFNKGGYSWNQKFINFNFLKLIFWFGKMSNYLKIPKFAWKVDNCLWKFIGITIKINFFHFCLLFSCLNYYETLKMQAP